MTLHILAGSCRNCLRWEPPPLVEGKPPLLAGADPLSNPQFSDAGGCSVAGPRLELPMVSILSGSKHPCTPSRAAELAHLAGSRMQVIGGLAATLHLTVQLRLCAVLQCSMAPSSSVSFVFLANGSCFSKQDLTPCSFLQEAERRDRTRQESLSLHF